jgi:hypothetical protein
LALTKWFEKPNYKRWSTEFSYPIDESAEQALEISARWLNPAGITHAPTIFLDDIEYPDIYTIDEVQRVYYQPTDLQIN